MGLFKKVMGVILQLAGSVMVWDDWKAIPEHTKDSQLMKIS
jgi:hypothetical protein